MWLYEIDREIKKLIDYETGEILDFKQFESLNLEWDAKIENLALYYKNLIAESEALKIEKNAFAEREKVAKNKAESIKNYLSVLLDGNSKKFTKVNISFRKSKSIEIEDSFMNWAKCHYPNFLKITEPIADKTAIKNAIENGQHLEFAKLVENNNIQIK